MSEKREGGPPLQARGAHGGRYHGAGVGGESAKRGSKPASETRKVKRKRRNIAKNEEMRARIIVEKFCPRGDFAWRGNRDVAKALGISTQAVDAAIQAGADTGEFTVLINLPREQVEVARLEQDVQRRYAQYGLRRVLLVPGLPRVLESSDQQERRALHTVVIRAMAQRLASYLDGVLAQAAASGKGQAEEDRKLLLGVAWGRTMQLFADYLISAGCGPSPCKLHVVPIVGITSAHNTEPIEANVIASRIAEAYGGTSAQLPWPAFVENIEASVAKQSKVVRDMLATIRDCQIVITSGGLIPESADGVAEIRLSNDPVMNEKMWASARANGAVGEICYWLFDRNGARVRADYTAIGLGFDGLRRVAQNLKRQSILVVGGHRRRFEALQGALRAGLASVLVSDTITARFLVGEL